MRDEKEIRAEVRRIRERVKALSGFWIGESSAAIYALEWAAGKRDVPPSEDLGRPQGGREKIAAALIALAARAPSPLKRKPPKPPGKPRPPSRPSRGTR
jgi:hypothetical protein